MTTVNKMIEDALALARREAQEEGRKAERVAARNETNKAIRDGWAEHHAAGVEVGRAETAQLIEEARAEGRREGLEDGKAQTQAREDRAIRDAAFKQGKQQGDREGYKRGRADGYRAGFTDAEKA